MRILGISCDFHDAAAALVVDGEVEAAAEEERFSRRKHDGSLPIGAIAGCLAAAAVDAHSIDAVVFHEKPLRTLNRVLSARQRRGPAALGQFTREFPVLLSRNAMVSYRIEQAFRELGRDDSPPLFYSEHHLSHAAAAYYPSPFESAAILTVDGAGEWSTAAIGHGTRHRVEQLVELRYPHSLGLLYSLVTAWCGFEPNDGEYKLMGLAPFGRPAYVDALRSVLRLHDDGAVTVDARSVRWWASTEPRRLRAFHTVFDGPPRRPDAPLTQRDADIARSIQDLIEESVLGMARHAQRLTGENQLVLGGGVAMNCVANGRLLRSGIFDDVWVQPAPGDAGSALGAALWYWHEVRGEPRRIADRGAAADGMAGAALGPAPTADDVDHTVAGCDAPVLRFARSDELVEAVADHLSAGAIVGWFEGRMEFGPRALGHRSILADPRSATVHADLNRRVKGRESFRPFAPAVLWEEAASWFEIDRPSRFMSFTFQMSPERLLPVDEPTDLADRAIVPRSEIPACTHVDGSARVQTVHADTHPIFHALLAAFHRRTGCPVLLNTSFNRAGEPIVQSPQEALECARSAGLDLLVIGSALIDLRPTGAAST